MYDIRVAPLSAVRELFDKYHPYKGVGNVFAYVFACYEEEKIVAAFAWTPPPPGCAKSVCPEEPAGVLALSRMVAVPKEERKLKHISKPLMQSMKKHIDRERWPVLVTFSDEALHTGWTYQCSGWKRTSRRKSPKFLDANGARTSVYAAGGKKQGLTRGVDSFIQRGEHWACPPEQVRNWMEKGYVHKQIPGKWKSGAPKFTWEKK